MREDEWGERNRKGEERKKGKGEYEIGREKGIGRGERKEGKRGKRIQEMGKTEKGP